MQVDLNKHKDYIVNELVYWVSRSKNPEDLDRLITLIKEEL